MNEQSALSIISYEKDGWNVYQIDKLCICIKVLHINDIKWSQWGSLYDGASTQTNIPYPVKFKGLPWIQISKSIKGGISAWVNYYNRGSKEFTPSISFLRPTTASEKEADVHFLAVGEIEEEEEPGFAELA